MAGAALAVSNEGAPRAHSSGAGEVLLPVAPIARLLVVELCQPGPLQPAAERDGWVLYRIDAAGGGVLEIAMRTPSHPDYHADAEKRDTTDDAMAAEFWGRARSHPKAQLELQAMLAYLAERHGLEDQFRWGEVARTVYGVYAKSTHTDLMRICAAFLGRAHFRFRPPGRPPGPQARSPQAGASPWGGVPLVSFRSHTECEVANPRRCRHPLTATLHPSLASALRERRLASVDHLRLPQDWHSNPKGHRASRVTLGRLRAVAFFDWHEKAEPDDGAAGHGPATKVFVTTLEELLRRAAIDVEALTKRRHLGEVFDDVVRALKVRVGVGLRTLPERAHSLLTTMLRIEGPSGGRPPSTGAGATSAPAASSSRTAASSGSAAGAPANTLPSRSPP